MTEWAIWGVLLILQNAAHTATSRARNSKGVRGLWYNGIASVFSNGIWFASQFFIVNMLINVKDKPAQFALTCLFYVVLTMFGSVASQWYLYRAMSRQQIFEQINKERAYQNERFGVVFDDKNTVNDWAVWINNYLTRATDMSAPPSQQYTALVKVASLAVAALEAFERNGRFAFRHFEGNV